MDGKYRIGGYSDDACFTATYYRLTDEFVEYTREKGMRSGGW